MEHHVQRPQRTESGFARAVREVPDVEGCVRYSERRRSLGKRQEGRVEGMLDSGCQRALMGPEVRKDTWDP